MGARCLSESSWIRHGSEWVMVQMPQIFTIKIFIVFPYVSPFVAWPWDNPDKVYMLIFKSHFQ